MKARLPDGTICDAQQFTGDASIDPNIKLSTNDKERWRFGNARIGNSPLAIGDWLVTYDEITTVVQDSLFKEKWTIFEEPDTDSDGEKKKQQNNNETILFKFINGEDTFYLS